MSKHTARSAVCPWYVFDIPKVRYSEGSIIRKFDIPNLSTLVNPVNRHSIYIIVNLFSWVDHTYETGYSHAITVTDVNNVNNYYVPVAL
jgi:hypothetical protein